MKNDIFLLFFHKGTLVFTRAVDPHSFFAFLNADPDPTAFLMRIRIQLCKKLHYEEFSVVKNKH